MVGQNDHMRYFPDTWGGADVGPASPINWLRFVTLVNPDQQPVTYATCEDPAVRVQRFGEKLPVYFTLLNPTKTPRQARLLVDPGALGLNGQMVAVEMCTSASLPLHPEGRGESVAVSLGPEEVAVVALLPVGGVGAWYRERAAEALHGAALVYAQTPPTNAAEDLARRLTEAGSRRGAGQVARVQDRVRQQVRRLARDSAELPADLKRVSYRRELSEADRLLGLSLAADRPTAKP